MRPDSLTLGERIHIARARAKLDQQQLADKLSVSRPLVSKWERDASRPDLSQKIRLARALGQPLDVFCDDDDLIDLRTALEVGIRGSNTGDDLPERQSGWTAVVGTVDPCDATHEGPRSPRAKELCPA